jgi:heme-degrading monooxygenase HmoA
MGDAMRVFLHVTQYIKEEGFSALEAIVRDHRDRLSKYEGFVSLRRLHAKEPQRDDEFHLTLEFESEELLMRWRQSDDHVQIAERYKPYWTQDPVASFYTVEDVS